MTDDTRQTRIDEACNAYNDVLHAHARGYLAKLHTEAMTAALQAADAIGRERVSAEMVNAAVEAFNAVTQQRTGKSLYGTWWPYEYLPAMKAALEAALLTAQPDPGTGKEQS